MESVRALFTFQPPYKVLRLHQQSILQRVGWGATLKLLCRHWDHVTRPALWFRAALEINGRGLFKATKCADTAFRQGLCGSTWYRSQPATGLFTWVLFHHIRFDECFWLIVYFVLLSLHFVCIDKSLLDLYSACLAAPRPPVFLGQMPQP